MQVEISLGFCFCGCNLPVNSSSLPPSLELTGRAQRRKFALVKLPIAPVGNKNKLPGATICCQNVPVVIRHKAIVNCRNYYICYSKSRKQQVIAKWHKEVHKHTGNQNRWAWFQKKYGWSVIFWKVGWLCVQSLWRKQFKTLPRITLDLLFC